MNDRCLLNMVRAGKTPVPPLGEAEAIGYRLTIVPSLLPRTIMMAWGRCARRTPLSSKGMPFVRGCG